MDASCQIVRIDLVYRNEKNHEKVICNGYMYFVQSLAIGLVRYGFLPKAVTSMMEPVSLLKQR